MIHVHVLHRMPIPMDEAKMGPLMHLDRVLALVDDC